jgi:hypothetical protein
MSGERDAPENNRRSDDLQDSKRDQERLKPDEAQIDLPDVRDIPGQEHIHVPPLGEMADTTISSADEEGAGIFEDDEEDETFITMGTENDIPRTDKVALESTDHLQTTDDDNDLRRSTLDQRDFEGERLNESFDRTGADLDVPGTTDDDRNEEIGAEDEENNSYSLGGDDNESEEK